MNLRVRSVTAESSPAMMSLSICRRVVAGKRFNSRGRVANSGSQVHFPSERTKKISSKVRAFSPRDLNPSLPGMNCILSPYWQILNTERVQVQARVILAQENTKMAQVLPPEAIEQLERLCRQYLQLHQDLDYPSSEYLRNDNFQQSLYQNLFAEGALKYPPSLRYQLRVLKELTKRIEQSIQDWEEEV